jgi:protein SCO1/2
MAMIVPQFMIGAFIVFFWWGPLRELSRQPWVIARYLGAAALLVAGSATGFALSAGRAPTGELPFPAEELRTAYEAPQFALTNQLRETVSLGGFQGNVVILTAVYASCPHTCPAILSQTKAAIAELSPVERADLRVIAVTMDPESDSPDVLRELAKNHGMHSPLYHLVTGHPVDVERLLDRMEIARQRDAETGVISHANLFLLIDRDGRIAYRLGLGERQQRWLVSALRVLLRELAKNHGMHSPLYHLVTGHPVDVERLLDRMEIARQRDAETGVISHANLFLLIDRDGRIAYRLGLGERQQRWLVSALRVLLREEVVPG